MRVKRAIKIVAFILLFCLALLGVTNVMISYDSHGYQNIKGFYNEPKNSLDAVYIGSSNCFAFWNSMTAWKGYGITVFPFACSANLYYTTEYLIKEARKTQPDAVFLVNINSLSDGEVNIQQIRNLIDCMPLSVNKVNLINRLSDLGGYSFEDRFEFFLPIIRYHSRWTEITEEDFSGEFNGVKGASIYEAYLTTSNNVSGSYFLSYEKAELAEDIISTTESLLDYCDREGVKVVFVTVPQARGNEYDMQRYNALNELLEERGYPVLDLMDKTEDIGLDLSCDYYNNAHTNVHGSIKLTRYISEYLIENYGFTDKRDDADYEDWNESLKKYEGIIAPYVLDLEIDGERDTSLKIEWGDITVSEGAGTLVWAGADGADGYIVYRKTVIDSPWELLGETGGTELPIQLPTEEESVFYYTIVPYTVEDGVYTYGSFYYQGYKIGA